MAKKANTLQMGLMFETSEEAPPEPRGAVAVAKEPKRARRATRPEPRVTALPATNADASRREEVDEKGAGRQSAKQSQPGNLPLECVECGRVFGREEARFVFGAPPGRAYVGKVVRHDGTGERPRYVATCLVSRSPGEPTCLEVFRARPEESELSGLTRKQDRKGSIRR